MRIQRPVQFVVPTLSVLMVLLVSACGHVAANYPVKSTPKSALPEEFKTPRGKETVLVWEDPNRVHGFLNMWRDTGERADIFKKLASSSGLEVHREGARMYGEMSRNGIAEATLWVFFGKGVEVRCSTGDFEVLFDDGTRVADLGILRVEPRDMEKPYRYTKEGGVILSSDPVGKGNPLVVILFLPAEHLGKRITSVTYVRDA